VSGQAGVECKCLPGYTGKYCQYVTSFRLDGTYSAQAHIETVKHQAVLGLDFKVRFFHEADTNLPLVYFTTGDGKLLLEVTVHRHYLRIANSRLGILHHLAFYYPYFGDSRNYEDIWHSLSVELGQRQVRIVYSVAALHLSEAKLITLQTDSGAIEAFSIGKLFSSLDNEGFLSGACVRDVVLNGRHVFKVNPYVSEDPRQPQPVKFGCSHASDTCALNNCLNNSTCVHRWFNYECAQCQLPFYGRNCHLQAHKLGFIQPQAELVLVSADDGDEPASNMFKISFGLSRISKLASGQSANKLVNLATLRQASNDPATTYYYMIGVEPTGFINLKRVLHEGTRRSTQWSLSNEHFNLNAASAVRVSLKLSEHFIEISLNEEFMSRFEIVDNKPRRVEAGERMFRIEEVKFSNSLGNGSELFLVYGLRIMERLYEFRNEQRQFRVSVLGEGGEVFKVRRSSNIVLFEAGVADGEIVRSLNENFCDRSDGLVN